VGVSGYLMTEVILRSLISVRAIASAAALAVGVGAPAAVVVNQSTAQSGKQQRGTARPRASWTDATWSDFARRKKAR
jgi:hypothetical protein